MLHKIRINKLVLKLVNKESRLNMKLIVIMDVFAVDFLLGSDITKQYYQESDAEWVLKTFCGIQFKRSVDSFYRYMNNPDDLLTLKATSYFVVPAYINKETISSLHTTTMHDSYALIGHNQFIKKCKQHGILRTCEDAENESDNNDALKEIAKNEDFVKDVGSILLKYYNDHKLCINSMYSSN